MDVYIPAAGFTVICLAIVSTVAARFFVGRYLSTHFGRPRGAEDDTAEDKPMTTVKNVVAV
jgi:hypothetical protein